jgi:general nucleoside transport system ATP-binding protein
MKLNLLKISKYYGSLKANDGVSLEIPQGMIMGILGENGAGKSTLMKILSGLIKKDSGEIYINDCAIILNSPRDAIKLGIGMLHQEPRDFPSMSIRENLRIGSADSNKKFLPDFNLLEKINKNLGFNLDLSGDVGQLTVGERQELELLRLLWLGVEVLILDEPTTGISAGQKDQLFSALRKLASEGKSILFVSHKLDEIQSLCNQAAVMRKGKIVDVLNSPFDQNLLVELMFGRKLTRISPCRSVSEDLCLQVKGLEIEDFRLNIKNINLKIKKGEVIGLAGMAGSGQRQFLQVLAGLIQPLRGSINLGSETINGRSCFHFQQQGIYYVPSSRLEEGLLPGMSLEEHFCLVQQENSFFIQKKENALNSQEKINKFRIKGYEYTNVDELSGGNQQRMLLSMLKESATLLLLDDPTRGLDIESANWIWTLLRDRCQNNTAIIFSSTDLEELLFYSDRIIVFFSGTVTQPLNATILTEESLGAMIGGKGLSKIEA